MLIRSVNVYIPDRHFLGDFRALYLMDKLVSTGVHGISIFPRSFALSLSRTILNIRDTLLSSLLFPFFFLPLLPFFPCLTGTLDLAFLDICIPCDIPIPVLHSLLNWIVIPHIPRMIVIASHFRSFHHSAYPPPRLLVSLLHQLSLLLDGNTVLLFAALPLSLFSLPHISLFCVQNVHAVNS